MLRLDRVLAAIYSTNEIFVSTNEIFVYTNEIFVSLNFV